MSVSVPKKTIDGYVRSMKNWDEKSKRELVERLFSVPDSEISPTIEDLFGYWEDDRTDEEIIADIYDSRTHSSEEHPDNNHETVSTATNG